MSRQRTFTVRVPSNPLLQFVQGTLFLASMFACASATAPVPEQAKSIAPLPQYALWWSMTEACSGIRGDMSRIKWFSHPDRPLASDPQSDSPVAGEYYYDSKSVVLVESQLSNPTIVRHEMLHALMGIRGHPAAQFRDACGGTVNCVDACARSVGSVPVAPPDADVVTVDSLRVLATVAPSRISKSSDTDGWFSLTMEVTNPLARPVWVRLQPMDGDAARAATFGFATPTGSQFNNMPGQLVSFAAGETKRVVFDLTIGDVTPIADKLEITPFYNSTRLSSQVLDITQ